MYIKFIYINNLYFSTNCVTHCIMFIVVRRPNCEQTIWYTIIEKSGEQDKESSSEWYVNTNLPCALAPNPRSYILYPPQPRDLPLHKGEFCRNIPSVRPPVSLQCFGFSNWSRRNNVRLFLRTSFLCRSVFIYGQKIVHKTSSLTKKHHGIMTYIYLS